MIEIVVISVRLNTTGLSEEDAEMLVNSTSWKIEQQILAMQEDNKRIEGYSLTFANLAEWAAKIARSALIRIWKTPHKAWDIADETLRIIGPSPQLRRIIADEEEESA